MDNVLLNGPVGDPWLWGGIGGAGKMSLEDAASKGVLTMAEASSCHKDGKDYPMFQMGLAAFAQDGPESKLALAIMGMREEGVLRAWTGGKALLSNAEIAKKTVAEVSAAPRSGPLLVLKEWDEMSPSEQAQHEQRVLNPWDDVPDTSSSGFGPDAYRFEIADPGLVLPFLVAMRNPTDQEMAATPARWYADRMAALEVLIDPTGGRDGATVYTEAGCKGRSRHFFEGRYSIDDLRAGIGNDTIASVSVGNRFSITLHSAAGFSGQSRTYTGDGGVFASRRFDLPQGLSKEVSSLVVTNHRSGNSSQHQVGSGSAGSSTGYTLLDNGRYR
ncbi:hypothetical protein [Streptomyces sp. NPDC058613]|uniref:hypothetical protein n=1 Tax=unclassified Streptomyces TaxID=2593676 RepID=UPI0036610944